jgi:hypothetical protein
VRGLQERLERASLGAVFGWTTAVFFVVRTLIDAATGSDVLHPVLLVARLVSAAIFGGLMAFIISRQRRRSGGTSVSADITQAQRTGRVPLDADPATWIPALEWRRGQFRRSTWLSPIVLGVFALMGVALVVLEPTALTGYLVVLVFVVLGTVTLVQARRTLPRIEDMLRQLRARAGAPPVADADPVDASPSTGS